MIDDRTDAVRHALGRGSAYGGETLRLRRKDNQTRDQ
jgi:hypothetical protein